MNGDQKKLHDDLIKALVSKGKLIEAGFVGLRIAVIPPDASETQISEMRMAFMAGAQHLFTSMIAALDHQSAGETDGDLAVIAKIDSELRDFARQMVVRHASPRRVQ